MFRFHQLGWQQPVEPIGRDETQHEGAKGDWVGRKRALHRPCPNRAPGSSQTTKPSRPRDLLLHPILSTKRTTQAGKQPPASPAVEPEPQKAVSKR